MGNMFNSINTGLRALQTQKKSLDVTGHNIANANNEDYSRQKAVQSTTSPHAAPGMNSPAGAGQMGTGVKVAEIKRMRDAFIDSQIQEESQGKGTWSKVQEGLDRIESIFNEPSDSGLSEVFNQFWESLQDLGNNPEDTATRSTVKQRAESLISTFHNLEDQMTDYQKSLNNDVVNTVDDINSIGERIADLNKQIKHVDIGGDKANDLMDRRNGLLKELSEKVNINARVTGNSELQISISGNTMVQGGSYKDLEFDRDNNEIKFADSEIKPEITGGELKGIMEVKDDYINKYKGELDKISGNFVHEFNRQHRTGFGLNPTHQAESTLEINDETDNLELEGSFTVSIIDENGNIEESEIEVDDGDSLEDIVNNNPITEGSLQIEDDELTGKKLVIKADDSDHQLFLINTGDPDNGEINILEELGIGSGIDFFTGDQADNIELTDAIAEDEGYSNIAAASTSSGVPGDGDNAVDLADTIKEKKTIDDSSVTEYFESVVSEIGVEGQRAGQMQDNQEALVEQLEGQQEEIAGVSLDDEMGEMIKYQQAYNAAAKIISSTDQMLDSLMSIIR